MCIRMLYWARKSLHVVYSVSHKPGSISISNFKSELPLNTVRGGGADKSLAL
jgi:hypothetical protein